MCEAAVFLALAVVDLEGKGDDEKGKYGNLPDHSLIDL